MLNHKKVVVVLPAYNAAKTLRRTVDEIPREIVDEVILTDDASSDNTSDLAREMGLITLRHDHNRGYGGNQKTCYTAALAQGADIVVMLHPDYQYTPKLVSAMASMIAYGQYDGVLASRILGRGALKGGMPLYKYIANRGLTFIEKRADPGEDVGIPYRLSRLEPGVAGASPAAELLRRLCVRQPDGCSGALFRFSPGRGFLPNEIF
jgi:glycosyltransferase involved in cell wall biosynthesis